MGKRHRKRKSFGSDYVSGNTPKEKLKTKKAKKTKEASLKNTDEEEKELRALAKMPDVPLGTFKYKSSGDGEKLKVLLYVTEHVLELYTRKVKGKPETQVGAIKGMWMLRGPFYGGDMLYTPPKSKVEGGDPATALIGFWKKLKKSINADIEELERKSHGEGEGDEEEVLSPLEEALTKLKSEIEQIKSAAEAAKSAVRFRNDVEAAALDLSRAGLTQSQVDKMRANRAFQLKPAEKQPLGKSTNEEIMGLVDDDVNEDEQEEEERGGDGNKTNNNTTGRASPPTTSSIMASLLSTSAELAAMMKNPPPAPAPTPAPQAQASAALFSALQTQYEFLKKMLEKNRDDPAKVKKLQEKIDELEERMTNIEL